MFKLSFVEIINLFIDNTKHFTKTVLKKQKKKLQIKKFIFTEKLFLLFFCLT